VVGIIVIVWPGPTVAILMILVGIDAILFGASLIAQWACPPQGLTALTVAADPTRRTI